MGRKWDYANLSKLAKKSGGPEKFVKALQESSYLKGMAAGKAAEGPKKLLFGIGGALIGGVVMAVIDRINKTDKSDKTGELTAEETAAIEQEIISGIKQYDAEVENEEAVLESEEAIPAPDEESVSDAAEELDSCEPDEPESQTNEEESL